MSKKSKPKQKQYIVTYSNGSVDVIKAQNRKVAKRIAIGKLKVQTRTRWGF